MGMQTGTEKLIARSEGAIGWIVFNNPQKRNAVSLEMWKGLGAALDEFTRDSAIRVVILKGIYLRRGYFRVRGEALDAGSDRSL